MNNIYWSLNKSLTYNALFNFYVGSRGPGKTFSVTNFITRQFLKYGHEAVYVRRFASEFDKFKQFYDDMCDIKKCPEFSEVDFKVDGHCGLVNGDIAVRGIPLTTAKIAKSVPFPNVKYIFFDEFILDKGVHHYLKDEVTAFLELYETIARMRDVIVFFNGNNVSITNPYFIYFKLHLPSAGQIWRNNDLLVENVTSPEFIAAKENTRFGALINGTPYGDYAIKNVALRDSLKFVEKKSGRTRYLFTIVYNGSSYGVWEAADWSKVWVSADVDDTCKFVYSLTTDDHTTNTRFIKHMRNMGDLKRFMDDYKQGFVRFESINIQNIMEDIFQKMI